jgi:hypothetical protein
MPEYTYFGCRLPTAQLSAFSYIFPVLITASCHSSLRKLGVIANTDMEPHSPATMNAETGLCARGATVPVCQLRSALTLNVTFKSLDIFWLRCKLRSTVTSGMSGYF